MFTFIIIYVIFIQTAIGVYLIMRVQFNAYSTKILFYRKIFFLMHACNSLVFVRPFENLSALKK